MSNLHTIATKRWKIAGVLSVIMLTIYFGFILLVAFNKPLLTTVITNGLTLGILLGALVIVGAWVLTLIYVNWANNVYDAEVAALKR